MWSGPHQHIPTKNKPTLPTHMQSNNFYLGFLNCPELHCSVLLSQTKAVGSSASRTTNRTSNGKLVQSKYLRSWIEHVCRTKVPYDPYMVSTMSSDHSRKSVHGIAMNGLQNKSVLLLMRKKSLKKTPKSGSECEMFYCGMHVNIETDPHPVTCVHTLLISFRFPPMEAHCRHPKSADCHVIMWWFHKMMSSFHKIVPSYRLRITTW